MSGLAGCAELRPPANHATLLYDPEKTAEPNRRGPATFPIRSYDEKQCAAPGTPNFLATAPRPRSRELIEAMTMRYSIGDRFNVQVPGAADFNGDYVVNADGRVILPFAGEVRATGLTNKELTAVIERAFLKARLFQPDGFKIAVRPVQYASINVTVAGAVFLPGRFAIAHRDEKGDKSFTKFGDYPTERSVAVALKVAGGVRPDADLGNVRLRRDGKWLKLDWHGALLGAPVDDVPLIDGDHIEVGETGCFQSALMRPSQISPAGLRIYLSNLTGPATGNAGAGITKDNYNLAYGTRLLQALVSANCVGGSRATNAHRVAVLISRNPKTQRTEVIQRNVEQLVLSPDRDEINPYLLPEDSVACYDGAAGDIKEITSFINQLILPRATWRAN